MTDSYAWGVPLVEVVRSGIAESRHHGSAVVLDAAGRLVSAAGDVDGPLFTRSSNKPLQAIGMLRSGLRLADPADLALVCASHYGEDFHVARVTALLRGAGLDETALRCPPDLPLREQAREAVLAGGGGRARVFMNCSGKHAGMLLTCLAAGWPVEEYYDRGHPLQERLATAFGDFTGGTPAAVGVDGCGVPVFATSLRALAGAYLRLVGGEPGSVERTVADAMRACPQMVGGTGAPDTLLMAGVPGLLCKSGAEGVAMAAVPGVGAAGVKIDDGTPRARVPVLVSALRRLGIAEPVLAELAEAPVYGGGRVVGTIRSIW